MKRLMLSSLLSLCVMSGAFAAEKETADFQAAIKLINELKVARQELASASAIYQKESKKLENLDQNTMKKFQACFSLTNEEAKSKAFALDKKRGTESSRGALVELEKKILENYNKDKWNNHTLFFFHDQKILGEGHHLFLRAITTSYDINKAYLSTVLPSRKNSVEWKQTTVDSLETQLALVMANFSSTDLERFQKIITTLGNL